MMANLGYELDLSALSESEREEVKKQVAYYKSIRGDIQFGRLYRLLPPDHKDGCAFLTESPDKNRYYLFYFRELNKPNLAKVTLPLHYLSDGDYSVETIDFGGSGSVVLDANGEPVNAHQGESSYDLDGKIFPASFLNRFGFTFNNQQADFDGQLIVFTKR